MKDEVQEIVLNVGGAKVQITSSNTKILHALQERYILFLASGSMSGKPFSIHIQEPVETNPLPPENKIPVFSANSLKFSPPGWEGVIYPDKRTGWVRPASRYIIEELDYFLRVVIAVEAYETGGLLIHAAGIVRDGRAFVFLGPSGVGKTTVSRLSRQDIILNDDMILLMPDGERWIAHPTPFWNPTQVKPNAQASAPLFVFLRLKQDTKTFVEDTSPGYALGELIACIPVIASDPDRSRSIIARCGDILSCIPFQDLHFQKDDTFWKVIENVLKGRD